MHKKNRPAKRAGFPCETSWSRRLCLDKFQLAPPMSPGSLLLSARSVQLSLEPLGPFGALRPPTGSSLTPLEAVGPPARVPPSSGVKLPSPPICIKFAQHPKMRKPYACCKNALAGFAGSPKSKRGAFFHIFTVTYLNGNFLSSPGRRVLLRLAKRIPTFLQRPLASKSCGRSATAISTGAIWGCFEDLVRSPASRLPNQKGSAGALPFGIDVGAGLYVPLPPS